MEQAELFTTIVKLTEFQKRKLERFLIDALALNEEDKDNKPKCCTYCKKESTMIKKWFNHGRQRYRCKNCNHVYTYNSYTIRMYSKIERSVFQKIVLDTLRCVSIKKTVADLNLSIPCIFENRHKILYTLKKF